MIIGLAQAATAFEATLYAEADDWRITQQSIKLSADSKYFAPANLRAAASDERYRQLIDWWITHKRTLRYSGGLVPDVVHSLIKGQGIFCSPVTKSAPAKLRQLFECSAVALIVSLAGGRAVDHVGQDMMQIELHSLDQRTGLCCGSINEVQRFVDAMQMPATASNAKL